MLTAASPDRSRRVGLALAGGGPEGAVYEIGVLRALDEALEGVDFNSLRCYVGVSAGAFLSANLANGITTAQNVRAIVKAEPGEHPFVPETFFTPAISEMLRRGLMTPRLLAESLWSYLRNPYDMPLVDSFLTLSRALPVGVFDNEPVRRYLERIYALPGRSNDFRQLRSKLYVVATELDSGVAVRFGEKGRDHVPISLAVAASSALPGLYPPVVIEGRHYVDGVLLKTVHASVALEAGAKLVICVNPIVPVDTLNSRDEDAHRRRLTDFGLPSVLSQTFRTLIHSRMTVGMSAYAGRFPDQDIVLIEPGSGDDRMFFTNIFSFASRKELCEYAYQATLRDLRQRAAELGPLFAKHGIRLRERVLADESRDLWKGVGLTRGVRPGSWVSPATALDEALARLDSWFDQRAKPEPHGPRTPGRTPTTRKKPALRHDRLRRVRGH
jgi:predicted acylesterase/phospholipase RssA